MAWGQTEYLGWFKEHRIKVWARDVARQLALRLYSSYYKTHESDVCSQFATIKRTSTDLLPLSSTLPIA